MFIHSHGKWCVASRSFASCWLSRDSVLTFCTSSSLLTYALPPSVNIKWGIQWCFCHNGDIPAYRPTASSEYPLLGNTLQRCYHPVGDTDSEAVFCAILNALKAEFSELPTLPVLHETLRRLCDEIIGEQHDETIFNFLLGCGEYTQFAYSWPGQRPGSNVWNGLYYIVREPPFDTATLIDVDYSIDFAKVTNANDRVAVITTKPLTNEPGWTEFKRGELLMFNNGIPYSAPGECELVERAGRGLCSKALRKCESSPIPIISSSPSGVDELKLAI